MKLGYHKIRGLGAPARMMFHYKKQEYTDVAYGADMNETWFGGDKKELAQKKTLSLTFPT